MKCLSLFSGIGGFDLALRNKGHEIVCACEIDKYARSVYGMHFPDVPIWENATTIKPEELPEFDLLCAGFPCQAFSIAGKRRGFADTRGSLFFEIARIAKEKRPSILLLENVKGLLSHDQGKTFKTILRTLDEIGYDAQWQVLNSKYFVPQNRERVFIIGHLRGKRTRQVFPLGEIHAESDSKKLAQIGNIDNKGHNSLWGRIYDTDGISATITAKGGGLGAKTGLYAVVNDRKGLREVDKSTCLDANYHKGHDYHGARTMIYLANSNANMRQRVQSRDKSWCLTNNSNDFAIKDGIMIRKLTPVECERLQGFPDNYTKFGSDNVTISDTQRYKMCGNAVTVPVIEYIIDML